MDTGRKIYVVVGRDFDAGKFDECFVAGGGGRKGEEIVLREDFVESVDDLGYRLSLILDELRYDRPFWLSAQILVLPDTKDESSILTMDQHEFLKHLIEDASRIQRRESKKNAANMSYVDFLVYIHRQIQNRYAEM